MHYIEKIVTQLGKSIFNPIQIEEALRKGLSLPTNTPSEKLVIAAAIELLPSLERPLLYWGLDFAEHYGQALLSLLKHYRSEQGDNSGDRSSSGTHTGRKLNSILSGAVPLPASWDGVSHTAWTVGRVVGACLQSQWGAASPGL